MKTYRILRSTLLAVLTFALVLPVITWLSIPGSTINVTFYTLFLLPAILITILFLLIHRLSRTIFEVALFGGAVILLACALVFSFGPISLILYILGAVGLYTVKRMEKTNPNHHTVN